tara:strand:+ start:146 stop:694 length:549 start_codon:yes stop_codon:yes gene_type:complete
MSKWDAETAQWYADNYGEYETNKLGIHALTLPSTATVIDIGCGTGCALRHAAKQVTHGSLIGIDPVPRMVEIAQERTEAAHILYMVGSAENIPVETAIADIVLAFDSFDHWQDQKQGLEEVKRIVKPNGQLVVIKDGGVPDGDKSRQIFVDILEKSGFNLIKERAIKDDDISFTMWTYEIIH